MPLLRVVVGSTIAVDLAFADETGSPVGATGVTIQARSPSGILQSLSITATGPGTWRANCTANEPGEWYLRAACTGPLAQAVEARALVEPSNVLSPS
jgi:nitrogen fixation protein FixH